MEENYYDLILLDIQMLEVDRLTATIKIRGLNDAVKASIHIVALTANPFMGN